MDNDATILRAIATLKSELLATINGRFQEVARALDRIDQKSSSDLLDQERRNSTFADRARVEAVAEHAHDNASALTALLLRTSNLEQDKRDQQNELHFPLRIAITAVLLSVSISSAVAIVLHFTH